MKYRLFVAMFLIIALLSGHSLALSQSQSEPISVKVFIGSMFEIGENTGDKAGEFQFWFERYFTDSTPIYVKGAASPVFCNHQGICGSVLGMGKVASSSSMQAIILNKQFDMEKSYFLITGVAGTPPSKGTIGDVSWGSWLVDYDLGHRWHPSEGELGAPTFTPRKGYESIRRYQLNPHLLNWAVDLSRGVKLRDSDSAMQYRLRYPQAEARRKPAVSVGTHMTGDTFFHGPGLSAEAQYIAHLYGADDYVITEMEAAAIAQVLDRTSGTQRMMSLRGAVNFDQGHPSERTLDHLDPAPGETAGGFEETLINISLVGSNVVDHIVTNWDLWQHEVPPLK